MYFKKTCIVKVSSTSARNSLLLLMFRSDSEDVIWSKHWTIIQAESSVLAHSDDIDLYRQRRVQENDRTGGRPPICHETCVKSLHN